MVVARAGDRRVEHRRDGPHRADAAVGDQARRLPGAGPHRRRGGRALRRRARAPGRGLLRDRARGRPGAGGRADHARRSRSRRSGSAPAPAATARCSSGTTCSGCTTGRRRGSSSGTRRSPRRSASALAAYIADVRAGAFPEEQHTYSIPEAELEALRGGAGREVGRAAPSATGATARRPRPRAPTSSRAPRRRRARAGQIAHARKPSMSTSNAVPPPPESEPPRWNSALPHSASFTGQSTSESATGTDANARIWRARRYEPCEPSSRAARCRSAAEHEVGDAAVEPAREEDPDRDEQPVVVLVVHQVRRGARREDEGDPGEPHDREHRLRPAARPPPGCRPAAPRRPRGAP